MKFLGVVLPFLIFFLLVGWFHPINAQSSYGGGLCTEGDSLVLVNFYYATDGPNWTYNSSATYNDLDGDGVRAVPNAGNPWLVGPVDQWHGVSLNADGCVEELILWWGDYLDGSGVGVRGQLPDELGDLAGLWKLEIPHNKITGSLPAGLQRLPEIKRILLQYNSIQGGIPFEYGNMNTLVHLAFFNNSLTGEIPAALGFLTELEIFHLRENNLSGPLPDNLCNLTKVYNLDVSGNALSGTVPECFTRIGENAIRGGNQAMWMQNNRFDSLPDMRALQQANPKIFEVNGNGLTFDDILPSLQKISVYAPQDSFYADTVISVTSGENLTIDLGIDADIASNQYQWFFNGTALGTRIVGDNTLNFNNLQLSDAGEYHCQVSNNNAGLLTLYSRKITLIVRDVVPLVVECPEIEDGDGDPDLFTFYANPDDCLVDALAPEPVIYGGCPEYDLLVEVLKDGQVIRSSARELDLFDIVPGSYILRYTVRDICGAEAAVDCNLKIIDDTAPIAKCRSGIEIVLDDQLSGTLTAIELDGGSTDNCGIESLLIRRRVDFDENCVNVGSYYTEWADQVEFDCCDAGKLIEVELAVIDIKGNDRVCTVEVTVDGTTCITPPLTVQCPVWDDGDGDPDLLTFYPAPGDCFSDALVPEPAITGGCPAYMVTKKLFKDGEMIRGSEDDLDLQYVLPGSYVLQYVVLDQCGEEVAVDCNLKILDNVKPEALCRDDLLLTIDQATLTAELLAFELDAGSTDECGVDSLFIRRMGGSGDWLESLTFDCRDADQDVPVELRVVDIKGNESSCTAQVYIDGTVCRDALVVDCPMVDDGDGDPDLLTYFADPQDCFPGATAPVPIISGGCPDYDVLVEVLKDGEVIRTSAADLSFNDVLPGTYTLKYTVRDQCGEEAGVECNLVIVDDTPPFAICRTGLTIVLDQSTLIGNLPAAEVDDASTDNCGVDSVLVRRSNSGNAWTEFLEFSCNDAGKLVDIDLRVVDIKGNENTCSTQVKVEEEVGCTDPLLVECPQIADGDGDLDLLTFFADSDDCFSRAMAPEPEISGGCAPYEVLVEILKDGEVIRSSAMDLSFNDVLPGSYILRYTVRDQCGEIATAECALRIADVTNPIARCQVGLVIALEPGTGTGTLLSSEVDAGSTDNCLVDSILIRRGGTGSEWVEGLSFDCNDEGQNITIELRIVDGKGNEDICSTDVQVGFCVDPLTVDCPLLEDGDGNLDLFTYFADPDDCFPGASAPPPLISGGCPEYEVLIEVLKDGEVLRSSAADLNFNDILPGSYVLRYTVRDQCGEVATVDCDLRIVDDTAPEAFCRNGLSVKIDSGTLTGTLAAAEVDDGSTDNCGVDSLLIRRADSGTGWFEQLEFTCGDEGQTISIELRVVDIKGNESFCLADVEIDGGACRDPLTVACPVVDDQDGDPNLITFVVSADDCSIGSTLPVPVVTGGCPGYDILLELLQDGQVIRSTRQPLDFAGVLPGSYVLRYTVRDQCGEVVTADCNLRIVDDTAPEASCRTGIVVSLDAGTLTGTLSAAEVDAGSTDNCGIDSILIRRAVRGGEWLEELAFTCDDADQTVGIELRVVDIKGNENLCMAEVQIEGSACRDPLFVACPVVDDGDGDPDLVTFVVSADDCSIGSTLPVPVVTGGCPGYDILLELLQDGQVIRSTRQPLDFAGVLPGSYVLRYTVRDQCGEVVTADCNLRIVDDTAPEASCRTGIVVSLDAGTLTGTLSAAEVDAGSTDNCGIDSILIRRAERGGEWLEQLAFTCDDADQTVGIELRVVDIKGNENLCMAEVQIEGSACRDPLFVACPVVDDGDGDPDLVTFVVSADDCSIGSTLPVPVVTGGCPGYDILLELLQDGQVIRSTRQPLDFAGVLPGSYVLRYTVRDQCGEVVTADCNLRIVDDTAPEASCRTGIVVSLDAGTLTGTLSAAEVDAGSTDNCGIDSILIRRADLAGEWLEELDFTCNDREQALGVELRVVDSKGNEDICLTEVRIDGNSCMGPLLVSCPEVNDGDGNPDQLTLVADPEDCSTGETIPAPLVSGGCPEYEVLVAILQDGEVIRSADVTLDLNDVEPGSYLLRYTVEDECGNRAEVDCGLTIIDDTAPVARCRDDLLVVLDLGTLTGILTAQQVDAGSTDNCGLDSILIRRAGTMDQWADSLQLDCADSDRLVDIELRAVDLKGNESICSTSIAVDGPPGCENALAVSCPVFDDGDGDPDLITLLVGPEDCLPELPIPNPTIENGCASFEILLELIQNGQTIAGPQPELDFNSIMPGDYILRYTVRDQCFQEGQVECRLSIVDQTSPVAVCRNDLQLVIDGRSQTVNLSAVEVDGGSLDNCGIASLLIQRDGMGFSESLVFDCNDAGSVVEVDLMVVDVAGNTDTCSLQVLVDGLACDGLNCRSQDSLALRAIFDATGGPGWSYPPGATYQDLESGILPVPNSGNPWLVGPVVNWHGVVTNAEGCVEELILWSGEYNNGVGVGLDGPLPPETGSLSALRKLELAHNGLTGELPATLGQLRNLERLLLQSNAFGGRDSGEFHRTRPIATSGPAEQWYLRFASRAIGANERSGNFTSQG